MVYSVGDHLLHIISRICDLLSSESASGFLLLPLLSLNTFQASQVAQWSRIYLQCRRRRRCEFDSWVGKIPWRRKWQPTPVLLPEKSQGERSLVGYDPWGHKRVRQDWSDLARAYTHTHTHTLNSCYDLVPQCGFVWWLPRSNAGGLCLAGISRKQCVLLSASYQEAHKDHLSSFPVCLPGWLG